MIVRRGLQPDSVLLAGYLEGEEGIESGVVVTRNGLGYMFSRRVSGSSGSELWEEITDWESASNDFPALSVVGGLVDSL
jgi:hypothetical protein